MNPAQLSATVVDALASLVDRGALVLADGVPPEVTVERPRQKGHGDYATNAAMKLAKQAGMPPRDLAQLLAGELEQADGIAAVEVAGPGFLNVTVAAEAQGRIAADIVAAGASYGHNDSQAGERVNVEFISANPTGPLHLGHTRWAVVGDSIARVLEAAGASVTREFYINDRGNQMDLLGASVEARAFDQEVPADGYQGAYVTDLAAAVLAAHPELREQPAGAERTAAIQEAAYELQLREQREHLERFHTVFDVWFSERTLHEGDVAAALEKLRGQGHLFDADGALWMRTTDFGDDKDRVLIRSNGDLTYFASDTAYYVNKRERGFDRCLYLLGADHHGYVGRLKAMAACAGDDPERNIEVLIGQLVKILRDGEEIRLSKRAGEIVTLEELMDEIGVDALRYSLARYPSDSPLVLDVAEITKASNDNPVYYVQYGHARTCRMMANAADLGMSLPSVEEFDPSLLTHERDRELLRALADFPRVVAAAAELREPHRVARYLEDTVSVFNKWYDTRECRMLPVGDEPVRPVNEARLVLVVASRTVIANGLDLLGVTAPERM
ncbi:arginine--tRNA ligase [Nocardioides coralli]|uniref:arginine--tRNA ligase n=1 Tax=Nocardioides coralli TaxID=2872154 RepID=UPI001CA38854|nr:arginine--tRNA ligase [Nocardioides coralli]QZY30178.1 arginine--tRNA ligase [Nocardioides coralli]